MNALIYDIEIKRAILGKNEAPIDGIDYCLNDVALTKRLLDEAIRNRGQLRDPRNRENTLTLQLPSFQTAPSAHTTER